MVEGGSVCVVVTLRDPLKLSAAREGVEDLLLESELREWVSDMLDVGVAFLVAVMVALLSVAKLDCVVELRWRVCVIVVVLRVGVAATDRVAWSFERETDTEKRGDCVGAVAVAVRVLEALCDMELKLNVGDTLKLFRVGVNSSDDV